VTLAVLIFRSHLTRLYPFTQTAIAYAGSYILQDFGFFNVAKINDNKKSLVSVDEIPTEPRSSQESFG
jgi:hypothetical protein